MAKSSSNNRRFTALRGLTIASIKMYFRNRTAIFFSLFFPIVFIVVFGLIFKNTSASFKIDLTNQSHTQLAAQFEDAIKKVPAFKIKDVSADQAADDLDKGNAELTVTIPAGFGEMQNGHLTPTAVTAHYNEAKPGNGQAAAQIVQQLAGGFNDAITHTPKVVTLESSGVKTKNLSYIDFLLPGMIGLSIMQIGIFSVAFAFVAYKTTGMLRRIQATPIHPGTFLTAQGITRLIVAVLQTALLATIGAAFFGFHLPPSTWPSFIVLALLGSAVFMAFGFAIAGWAKNEEQAQPVAQLIQFPMMFLSGTFFPRDGFPSLLQHITAVLPLTFLTDALRHVANDGASLWAVRGDILGLVAWGIAIGLLAIRVFSWE
jgi:ABC-2 type transport system permease protein